MAIIDGKAVSRASDASSAIISSDTIAEEIFFSRTRFSDMAEKLLDGKVITWNVPQ